MSADGKRLSPSAASTRARRYQLAGILILILGVVGAGLVYWLGDGEQNAQDPAMLGFNRPEERQMAILYGKQGRLLEDFTQAARQPRNQAIFIMAVAGVVAVGCFGMARIMKQEAAAR